MRTVKLCGCTPLGKISVDVMYKGKRVGKTMCDDGELYAIIEDDAVADELKLKKRDGCMSISVEIG